MMRSSVALYGGDQKFAEISSFLIIGAGAVGCVIAGLLADRVGRTLVTSWAMAISGACCLIVGFLYGGNPYFLAVIAVIWGAVLSPTPHSSLPA